MSPRILPLLFTLVAMTAEAGQVTLVDEGRAALARGETSAAVAMLEKAVAQSPKDPVAHFVLATAYAAAGQEGGMLGATTFLSKMKAEFEAAIALKPTYVEARMGLMQFYVLAPGLFGGSFDKAFDQAKAIKTIDSLAGHRAYAFIYTRQKKNDLAVREYLDAIREQPKSPKTHDDYALHLAREKNYTDAFTELEKALQLDPSYAPALYHLGHTAALAGTNLARGEQALKQYLSYTPKQGEPQLAYAYDALGTIQEKQARATEARASYAAALKLNPRLRTAAEGLKRLP